MKTQISRDTHRPAKRYSGVYQQQGRMITDSDWNELVEILRRRLDEALRDVVDGGAPRERAADLVPATPDDDGLRFRIQPGWVYADGVAAEIVADPEEEVVGNFQLSQQADFPGASAPADTSGLLYVDIWERPVVSLEDPDPEDSEDPETDPLLRERARFLRDPALHGADTTTRTQTMAQIKWASEGTDLADAEVNPQRGDAPLDVTLREQQVQEDECDPCADEVAIATRTGNYLFRLEVHNVVGNPKNPDEITLKWSSENGAEQHRVGSETPEFKTDAWVYELYDETSEKHLGVHLGPGFSPARGELVEKAAGESYPTIDPEEWPWVRRWDGYCVLTRDGSGWNLVDGRDRTSTLATTGQPSAQGHVSLNDSVTLTLRTLTLSLELTDRTFVAGDFWLATVREVIHDTGDKVLEDAPPLGIVHHYLQLRRVDGTGALVDLTTDEERRLNFPPLTDLRAGDVGYETGCDPEAATPLFDADHDTVQKALDQICQLAAENIGYTTDCEPDAAEPLFGPDQDTVKKALDQICQMAARHIGYTTECAPPEGVEALFGAGQDTVKKALDQICQLAAANIAYSAGCTPPEGVEALFGEGQRTVGEALDQICQMAAEHVAYGGSCESGLFNGEPTVREALDRLCEIAAEHVGYSPHEECEDLQEAATVQEALDALCLRPTGGSVSRDIFQPGHDLRPGDAIYFDADANRYLKALADRPISTGLFLVSEVESAEEFTLLQAGYLDLVEAYAPRDVPDELRLKPGQYYFVSADELGALTLDEPVFGLSNPILYADSETGGYVLPWRPSQASQQQAIGLPLGAIIDWFRFDATQPLPRGFAICDGSVIAAADSPFRGQQLPDLVDRFVLGVSPDRVGEVGGEATLTHRHGFSGRTAATTISGGAHGHDWFTQASGDIAEENVAHGGPGKNVRGGAHSHGAHDHFFNGQTAEAVADNRPPYFGVLKLMRIV